MFTFVTNVTERVAARLVSGTSAQVRPAASDVEDLTVILVRDAEAPTIVSAFRRAGAWLDRAAPPRPPRGGTRRVSAPRFEPIVARPVLVVASDHTRPLPDMTPEMESLMRRASRR